MHRKNVPYTTESGVQIGIAWSPKPDAARASAIEYHAGRRFPFIRWAGWSALAVLAFVIIAGATR